MTNINQRLAGKTCIVTGSGGSIGRASALRFAAEGANVVGCDIAVPSAEETVRLVEQAGGSMMSVHPLDLTNKAQCERLVAAAVDRFGGVDVLFNNGAMAYFAWIGEMNDDTWYKTINEELNLVFLLTRAAWPDGEIQGSHRQHGVDFRLDGAGAVAGACSFGSQRRRTVSDPASCDGGAAAWNPGQLRITGHDRNQPDTIHTRRPRLVQETAGPCHDESNGSTRGSSECRGVLAGGDALCDRRRHPRMAA